ncbi:BLUF domain-containing protein [Sphingomonas humi]|uniref:BLUF domain-containing protein n=1 Tax=Sphingomonas humi TaxID=335630 RepID=A0ABP7S9D5_9SPHN
MERIVYISTCRTDPDRDMVQDILRTSRRNNRQDDLTGLLVVGGRRFLQVLEGPTAGIDAAYERIKADPRHFALVELSRRPVAARAFAGWNMGCEQIDGEDMTGLVDRLTEKLGDATLQAQFRSFVALHRTAA